VNGALVRASARSRHLSGVGDDSDEYMVTHGADTLAATRSYQQDYGAADDNDEYMVTDGGANTATAKRAVRATNDMDGYMDQHMVTTGTESHGFSAVEMNSVATTIPADDDEYMLTDGTATALRYQAERQNNRLSGGGEEYLGVDGVDGANPLLFKAEKHQLSADVEMEMEGANPLLFRRYRESNDSDTLDEYMGVDGASAGLDGSSKPNVAVFKAGRAGNEFAGDANAAANPLLFSNGVGPYGGDEGAVRANPLLLKAKKSNMRGMSMYFPEEDELASSSVSDVLSEPATVAPQATSHKDSSGITSAFFRPNLGVARAFGTRPSGRKRSSQLQNMFGPGSQLRANSKESPLVAVREASADGTDDRATNGVDQKQSSYLQAVSNQSKDDTATGKLSSGAASSAAGIPVIVVEE